MLPDRKMTITAACTCVLVSMAVIPLFFSPLWFAAAVGACEQEVFATEGDRTDGAFGCIIVYLNAPIVTVPAQRFPAGKGVMDRTGHI